MKTMLTLWSILLMTVYSRSQGEMHNYGNLQIHSGGTLTGFGNITNTPLATLINNGNIYLKRNLTNDQPSMSAGTGTLFLNGSTTQLLNGSQTFRTYNTVSDNAAGITLNNNLSVSAAHTFINGLITTSATPNYLIYEAGSSYSGSSDAAHVNGWVKKLGNTSFEFPVGNATYLRSIGLSPLSANSEFNVRYRSNTPSVTLMQAPLVNVDPAEYWVVNQVSGANAVVTLNWDVSKVPFPIWPVSEMVVGSWDGTQWTSAGGTGTGSPATTGTLTSLPVSLFNLFTLASTSYPLPLQLIRFDARRESNFTRIDWTTVNELNLSHFSIERSDDGISFYAIGNVAAHNRMIKQDYLLDDNKIIIGTAWYRLKTIALDGKESLSRTIAVSVRDTEKELALVTNPVKDKILLRSGNTVSGIFEYQLWQSQGHLQQQGTLKLQKNSVNEIPFKQSLPAGTYMLKLFDGKQSFQYKIVHL